MQWYQMARCQKCGKNVYCPPRWDVDGMNKIPITLNPIQELGHVAVYGEGRNQLVAACVPEDGIVVIYNVWTQEEVKRIIRRHWNPVALAYRADGSLYVGDTNCRICVYSPHPDLKYTHSFGREGRDPGHFDWAVSMAFTSQGCLLVAEAANERVQVLRDNGEFVQFLETSPGNHAIAIPGGVCVAPSGHILVASLPNGLLIFNSEFQYVGLLKIDSEKTPYKGIHSVAVSFDGTVVVANESCVKVFRWLLCGDPEMFTVEGAAEYSVIRPSLIGTDMGELRVDGANNICVDNNGNIFTAKDHDIIRIRYVVARMRI